jgi:hypothetical protein
MPTTSEGPTSSVANEADLATFKFYEEAAEKAKEHAWSQTTWILTLNAATLGFSLNFYADHKADSAFVLIESIAGGVGVVLCLFLIYLLHEAGSHIQHYWTTSNKLAARDAYLAPFIGPEDAAAARGDEYSAPFPKFCKRLQLLAALFLAAHVGWVAVATIHLAP